MGHVLDMVDSGRDEFCKLWATLIRNCSVHVRDYQYKTGIILHSLVFKHLQHEMLCQKEGSNIKNGYLALAPDTATVATA